MKNEWSRKQLGAMCPHQRFSAEQAGEHGLVIPLRSISSQLPAALSTCDSSNNHADISLKNTYDVRL